MIEILVIALGGALGAVSRFLLGNLVTEQMGTDFPYAILFINVLGSFLIGVLFVLLVEERAWAPALRSLMIVGFLGSFTTFSTFSLQALSLLETGRIIAAATYIVGSVVLGLVGVLLGMFLARQFTV